MSTPFEHVFWRKLFAHHRGALFLAQAVAFVMLGMVIAGMLWRSPAETTSLWPGSDDYRRGLSRRGVSRPDRFHSRFR